ncbi:MAG: hypothetical protein K1W13_02825 [Lachnospiraceae bacterium]
MQERLSYITVRGRQIPLWCDIFALNEIQEKYGSIGSFERRLIGVPEEAKKDWRGIRKEPDVAVIIFALELMIREGYKKADMLEEGVTPHEDPKVLLMDIDIPFSELSDIVHGVYKRCFQSKK